MSLFKNLPDRIFVPLAGSRKALFEHALLHVYNVYYSSYHEPPTKNAVIATVAAMLRDCPDLCKAEESVDMAEEEIDEKADAQERARWVVTRLHECGWFECQESGYKAPMEFSPAALPLMQALVNINNGSVLRLEGVMQSLRAVLDKLDNGEGGYASALEQCIDHLNEICISMRATRTKLYRIRQEVMKMHGSGDRFRYLLDRYVSEIFQHDIAHLMSDRHPYRLKSQTLRVIDRVSSDPSIMEYIGTELAHLELVGEMTSGDMDRYNSAVEAGIEKARSQFARIVSALSNINDVARSIMEVKSRIDKQLATQGVMRSNRRRGDPKRLETLILEFSKALSMPGIDREDKAAEAQLCDRPFHLSEQAMRLPNVRRRPVAQTAALNEHDPVMEMRHALGNEYLHRIAPSDDVILAFLDRACGESHSASISSESVNDVDDFIALSTVLRMAVSNLIPPAIEERYRLICPDVFSLVDVGFMECPRIEIERIAEMRDAA